MVTLPKYQIITYYITTIYLLTICFLMIFVPFSQLFVTFRTILPFWCLIVVFCHFLNKLQNGDCHFLKKVTKKNFLVLFREKEPKSFFIGLRGKTLRKSCCVATHNGFLAIGQAARKPVICYFVNRRNICAKDVVCKKLQKGVLPLFEKSGAKTF